MNSESVGRRRASDKCGKSLAVSVVRVLEVHLLRANLDYREGREGRQKNFRAHELGDSDLASR